MFRPSLRMYIDIFCKTVLARRETQCCIYYTNPVKVLDDPDFFFFVLHVILNVVVVHVHVDVFFQFLVVERELESALQNKHRTYCHMCQAHSSTLLRPFLEKICFVKSVKRLGLAVCCKADVSMLASWSQTC